MAVPIGFAGAVAQLGERRFCKPEVVGSIPISSIPGVGCPDAPASRAYSPGASGGLTPIPDRGIAVPGLRSLTIWTGKIRKRASAW